MVPLHKLHIHVPRPSCQLTYHDLRSLGAVALLIYGKPTPGLRLCTSMGKSSTSLTLTRTRLRTSAPPDPGSHLDGHEAHDQPAIADFFLISHVVFPACTCGVPVLPTATKMATTTNLTCELAIAIAIVQAVNC